MTDLHRCYRGAQCSNAEVSSAEPGKRYGAAINAAEGLCLTCTRAVERAVAELPRDYVDLETTLAGIRAALRDIVVGGTRDLLVPISLSIEAAQAEMLHEAQCWAETVAERRGIWWDTQQARDSRPGVVLQRAAHILEAGLSVLLAQRGAIHAAWCDGEWYAIERDGIDGALALLDIHRRAQLAAGLTQYRERFDAPCPECERQALVREDGSDTIECAGCGLRQTMEDYEASNSLLAQICPAA